MGNHIFICYAREDQEFALELGAKLKDHGIPVWLDQWDIPGGADWDQAIEDALHDCSKFLIILTKTAVDSREVRGELQTALDEEKPIVPVLHQTCRIPRQLKVYQHIDFTAHGPEDSRALAKLFRALDMPTDAPPKELPEGDQQRGKTVPGQVAHDSSEPKPDALQPTTALREKSSEEHPRDVKRKRSSLIWGLIALLMIFGMGSVLYFLSPFSHPPKILSFTATDLNPRPAQPVTLRWEVRDATRVLLDGSRVSSAGSRSVSPQVSATYSLVAESKTGRDERTLTLNVLPPEPKPKILSFTATDLNPRPAQPVTLKWEVRDATRVLLDGSPVSSAGSRSVSPQVSATYSLVAESKTGRDERTLTLNVTPQQPPKIPQPKIVGYLVLTKAARIDKVADLSSTDKICVTTKQTADFMRSVPSLSKCQPVLISSPEIVQAMMQNVCPVTFFSQLESAQRVQSYAGKPPIPVYDR